MNSNNTWWAPDLDAGVAGKLMFDCFRRLHGEQATRRISDLANLRLYGSCELMGIDAPSVVAALPRDRLRLNVVQCVTDTALALLASSPPKIRFLTDGGNWALRHRAEQLTAFVAAQFYNLSHDANSKAVFLDALVFGTGFLKFYTRGGAVCEERVLPLELLVDDVDGLYGAPRTLYQHKTVERATLAELFPDHEKAVASAEYIATGAMTSSSRGFADPVSVVESWHLPPSDELPGRWVLAVSTGELDSGDYAFDYFPIVKFVYNRRPAGYFGQGIPEQLASIQLEINMLLQKIHAHMRLASSKIFVPNGSQVNESQLNNEVWGLVNYDGDRPPVPVNIPAISPEFFTHLDRLYQRAFEVTGVSQMAAQSTKPEGLNSGKAIREFNDVQSRRFLGVGQDWERFHLDCAARIVDLTREAAQAAQDAGTLVKIERDGSLMDVDWSEVDLEKDAYQMRGWPVNLLPDTPAGKTQTVQDLVEAFPQLQPYALDLLDYPDIKAVLSRVNAPLNIVDKIADRMLHKGEYIEPDKYMDLQGGIQNMQCAYLRARIEGVEASKLRLMRRWIDEALDIVEQMRAAAQMAAAEDQAAAAATLESQAALAEQKMPQGGALDVPAAAPTEPVL